MIPFAFFAPFAVKSSFLRFKENLPAQKSSGFPDQAKFAYTAVP